MSTQSLVDAVAAITESIPFNRLLGLSVERFEVGEVRVSFDMRPDLVGNTVRGILHGGVISATLDLVGGVTALAQILHDRGIATPEEIGPAFARFGTIDLRVDFLRPGAGDSFVATGTVLRAGKRVAVTRMALRNDSEALIAVGTGTYITG